MTEPKDPNNNSAERVVIAASETPTERPVSERPVSERLVKPAKPNYLQQLWKEVLEPLLFALVITTFLVTMVGVDGVSMMPNLRHHERVIVPKYETWLHRFGVGDFKRGDIVVFKPPASVEMKDFYGLWKYRPFLIKRLIGLPGDKIRVEKGVVFVNDHALSNDYTAAYWQQQGCWDTDSPLANQAESSMANIVPDQAEVTVPQGEYFVMGDNRTRSGSEDSRLFGPIPRSDVAGRAAMIVWPIMRQENAKYNCELVGANPDQYVTASGKSVLNWRILQRPETFNQDFGK